MAHHICVVRYVFHLKIYVNIEQDQCMCYLLSNSIGCNASYVTYVHELVC